MADRKKDGAGNDNHFQNILLDKQNLQNILRYCVHLKQNLNQINKCGSGNNLTVGAEQYLY